MIYIGIFLFASLAINFFYRAINLFIKMNRLTYSEQTKHSFRCSSCNQRYTLSGPETRQLTKGALRIKKSTPKRQVTFIKFACPTCGNYANQEKLFDLNTTKALGNIRIQMDAYHAPLILDFLLKGVLPIILVVPLLKLFV